MNCADIILTPTPPFDFEHSLSFLKTFHADGVVKKIEDGVLTQALLVDGKPVLLKLRSTGTVEAPELCGTVHSKTKLNKQFMAKVRSELSFYLGLDDDLAPFCKLASKDDAFRPIHEGLYGFHLVKFPSVFAATCWALVTQRTPNSFAFKTMRALTDFLGDAIEADRSYTTFPTPQDLLQRGAAEQILAATNNTRKTERLRPFSKRFFEGR